MRIVLSILISLLISTTGFSQFLANKGPVTWTFSCKKLADKTYEVHFTATMTDNYHIYTQKAAADGPIPTSFTFTKNPLLSLKGAMKEVGKKTTKYEEVWKAKISYFEGTADFVQVVKTKVSAPTSLKGSLEYMACDDKQCKPPKTVDFDIKLGN